MGRTVVAPMIERLLCDDLTEIRPNQTLSDQDLAKSTAAGPETVWNENRCCPSKFSRIRGFCSKNEDDAELSGWLSWGGEDT
jgi:hypothetical protein